MIKHSSFLSDEELADWPSWLVYANRTLKLWYLCNVYHFELKISEIWWVSCRHAASRMHLVQFAIEFPSQFTHNLIVACAHSAFTIQLSHVSVKPRRLYIFSAGAMHRKWHPFTCKHPLWLLKTISVVCNRFHLHSNCFIVEFAIFPIESRSIKFCHTQFPYRSSYA